MCAPNSRVWSFGHISLYVCVSVRASVTRRRCVKTADHWKEKKKPALTVVWRGGGGGRPRDLDGDGVAGVLQQVDGIGQRLTAQAHAVDRQQTIADMQRSGPACPPYRSRDRVT